MLNTTVKHIYRKHAYITNSNLEPRRFHSPDLKTVLLTYNNGYNELPF